MDCKQRMRVLVPWVSCAVAVLSLVLLIVIGITQVKPYDQSQNFQKAKCAVHQIAYNSTRNCDKSSPGSLGSYSCIIVTVSINDNDNISYSTLFDTEKELLQAECSYIPRICSVDSSENNCQVTTFEKSLAPNSFMCLQDLDDRSRVIRRREVNRTKAIHMLLWPTFFLVLSIIIAIWGMARAPRRTNVAYIEVPENSYQKPRRSIYRGNTSEDRERLSDE